MLPPRPFVRGIGMTCGSTNAGHVAAYLYARRKMGSVRPRSRAGFLPSWGGGLEGMMVSKPLAASIACQPGGQRSLIAWRELIVGLGPGGWGSGGASNGEAAAVAVAEGH
jgi:hypothetical protein